MRLLVLDTALHACTAACVDVDAKGAARLVAANSEPMRIGHAEALMPMVAAVFDAVGRDGFDRIAVTTGPGSFTGLRVALSAARGLALALRVPAFGVGTLAALAGAGSDVADTTPIAAVLDARRGEVYVQPFAVFGKPLAEPAIETAAAASARLRALSDGPWTLVGSGASLLSTPGTPVPADASSALDIARLGAAAPEAANPPRPLYLRAPDAKRPKPFLLGVPDPSDRPATEAA